MSRLLLTTLRIGKANTKVKPANKEGKKKKESKIPQVRQQAENLAYAACNRIAELSKQRSHPDGASLQLQNDDKAEVVEDNKLIQFRVLDNSQDETATWLYNLAFEPWAQSRKDSISQSTDISDQSSEITIGVPAKFQTTICEPGVSSSIVDKLLAAWTTGEENTQDQGIESPDQEGTNTCECAKSKKQSITFKAVGQQFTFPFHLIRKWKVSRFQHTVALQLINIRAWNRRSKRHLDSMMQLANRS